MAVAFLVIKLPSNVAHRGCDMAATRQPMRLAPSIPILIGGTSLGLALAFATHGHSGAASAGPAVVAVLPFALAMMTGAAKTTTA